MKKIILSLQVFPLITLALLACCNTPAVKVENQQNNSKESGEELDKVNQQYLIDYQNFKNEVEKKIAENVKSIVEFNAKIDHVKNEFKAEYMEKIAELSQRNLDMKKKMDDYKDEGKEKWEKFKEEFSRDMEVLSKAFKDFTIKNLR